MKLLIAVPTTGMWFAEFGHALAVTMADLAANPGPDAIRLTRVESSKLASARMDLAKEAIRVGADKICWLDTDMAFKPANVRALLAHDLDIVAANYPKKIPDQPSVCSALDGTILRQGKGVEAVGHVGLGLCVTKTSVFLRLPEPFFQFQWNPVTGDDIGEDVYFCRKAREHGIPVHVDHDASVGIKHIGKFPYQVAS